MQRSQVKVNMREKRKWREVEKLYCCKAICCWLLMCWSPAMKKICPLMRNLPQPTLSRSISLALCFISSCSSFPPVVLVQCAKSIWLENSRLNGAIDTEQRRQTNEDAKRTDSTQTLLVMQARFHVALHRERTHSRVRCILRMTASVQQQTLAYVFLFPFSLLDQLPYCHGGATV